MPSDLELALAKRKITNELAFSMLTVKQQELVNQHMSRYARAIKALTEKYGSPANVPVEEEDVLSNALYAEYPGEFNAMTAFALLEDKFLESGTG